MAIVTIPTRTDLGAYTFQVELDGAVYNFIFQFNDRESYWYFSILDESGNILRSGIKVTSNWSLLRLLIEVTAPPGVLLAVEPTDKDFDPNFDDLGDTVFLTYVEEASVP